MRKLCAAWITLATVLTLSATAPVCGQSADPVALQQPGGLPASTAAQNNANAGEAVAANPGEHPLIPAIRVAKAGLEGIRANIKDYSCTMVKRELVDGKLGDPQYIFLKVRHEPFSVYLNFLAPDEVKGQEVIWVDGQNDGCMLAHAGSGVKALMGTVALKPDSMIAMEGQRYPITEIGVQNLAHKLVEVAEHDSQFGECDVSFFPGSKVNGRVCTCITVTHPVPRRNFRYHLARVFIDDELQIPVRFEAYDWPPQPGEQMVLMEEYTYMNMKLNNGFTDLDFDVKNTAYKFSPPKK